VTPVVANTASLPEVVGEFGILIDPYSIDSIVEGFSKAIAKKTDSMRRMAMMEWAKKFSWETSAKDMLDTLLSKFRKTA
jgi:glycosyltransferase involved in cell wall biosynthesis